MAFKTWIEWYNLNGFEGPILGNLHMDVTWWCIIRAGCCSTTRGDVQRVAEFACWFLGPWSMVLRVKAYFIWLVVWNIKGLWLAIYWECHHPNWRTHIFQRGRYTTNQLWYELQSTRNLEELLLALQPSRFSWGLQEVYQFTKMERVCFCIITIWTLT